MRQLRAAFSATLPASFPPAHSFRLRPAIAVAAAGAAALCTAIIASLSGLIQADSTGRTAGSSVSVPPGLQQAIDRSLERLPQSSASGVSVRWASSGRVLFSAADAAAAHRSNTGAAFGLAPSTLGRSGAATTRLSHGDFVFGAAGTSEALGAGLTAHYKVTKLGVEQLFTLRQRPAGAGSQLVLSQRISGALSAEQRSPATVNFRNGSRVALTYTGLRVTDAHGRVLPSRLQLVGRSLAIRIDDARAAYPLAIDPTVIASPSLAASLTSSGTTGMGYSIAVAADGQTAAVGIPGSGEVLVYTGSGTSWSSTPYATLTVAGSGAFGYSVAVSSDGRTIVVGAPFTNASRGAAYVFTQQTGCSLSSCGWSFPSSPTATFTDSGASSGESFGGAVAISADGHTVIAAAPGASLNAGEAFLYTNSGGGWTNTPTTTFTGTGSDQLGTSLGLSGDGQAVVAGAPGASSGAGNAFLYTSSGSGWSNTPTADLAASGSSALGTSVAIAGDGHTVVAGAPQNGSGNGSVYVYSNSGSGWSASPSAALSGSGGEQFGSSVAMTGDGQSVTIGAPDWTSSEGQVLVYTKVGSAWPIQPTDTYTGSGTEQLGYSVSSSADGQTIGAGDPGAGSNAGAANIYGTPVPGYQSAPSWAVTGATSNDNLGDSVAISADGHTAVVGAPGVTGSDSNAQGGEVLIFKQQSNGAWLTTPTKTYSGSGSEYLGASVAVSADGQTVVAGADQAGSNNGDAFIYAQSGGSWPSSATRTFSGASLNDLLGASVGISADGQTVVVGEPGAGGSSAGAALVYTQASGSWANTPTSSTLTVSGTDWLGAAVAISGDGRTVVTGAPFTSGTIIGGTTQSNVGEVDIFTESGGTWSHVSPSVSMDTVAELGTSVAISANGQEIAAGGPESDFLNAAAGDGGGIVLFLNYQAYTLTQTGYATSSDGNATHGDELGESVAVSADGHTVAAGDPGADGGDGAVAVFQGISSSLPNGLPTTFQGTTNDDHLGGAVALAGDGQTVLVGAQWANLDDGKASLYNLLNATVTAANTLSFSYNSATHNAALFATLTSGGTALSGDTVNFTVKDSDGDTVGSQTSATTNGSGQASASFAVPAGQAPGTYTIQASYAGDGQTYAASSDASKTLTINKASQTVGFTSTAPSGGAVGGSYAASASSTSGLAVTLSVDSGITTNGACTVSGTTVSFVHVGTCGIDARQAGNADYNSASASTPQSITVGQGAQTISFTSSAPSNAKVGGASYTVAATGGPSGQPVSFSIDPSTTNGACTISGTTVRFMHAGSCVIAAAQAGGADYSAAATLDQTIAVGQAAQTLAFTSTAPSTATAGGPTYTVAATGGASGEPVTFAIAPSTTNGACTVSGSTVSFVAAGSCVITASQAGDADYATAPSITQTITVAAAGSSGATTTTSTTSTTTCTGSAIKSTLSAALAAASGKGAKITAIYRTGGISLKLTVACAGRLVIDWSSAVRVGKKSVAELVAAGTATVASHGSTVVKLRLTVKGRKLFRTSHQLKVTELASLTPSGGQATTSKKTVTLRRR
jgi:hypothetical protein